MMGEGESKAVQKFSENSSILPNTGYPKAIITQIIHWTDRQRKRRRDLSWDAATKIWVKKFQLNLRKANLAQSLNQGFVRFESSLHPYFTIFVGRLGNYFKLHPPFFKPAFQRRTFPNSFHLPYKTPHVSHMMWPLTEFFDGVRDLLVKRRLNMSTDIMSYSMI